MLPETQAKIIAAHKTLPGMFGGRPASEEQLVAFEAEYGPIPLEYRWYLLNCGGGSVGSESVDSISELSDTHKKFNSESDPSGGWTMTDVFVIGWDGWGNPFGIHTPTGRLLVEDHDVGEVLQMAPSFEKFLVDGLLPNGRVEPPPLPGIRKLPDRIDCEALGLKHQWFNLDGIRSGCYNCQVERVGELWRRH